MHMVVVWDFGSHLFLLHVGMLKSDVTDPFICNLAKFFCKTLLSACRTGSLRQSSGQCREVLSGMGIAVRVLVDFAADVYCRLPSPCGRFRCTLL